MTDKDVELVTHRKKRGHRHQSKKAAGAEGKRHKGQRKDHHVKVFKTPKETAMAFVTVAEAKASYTIFRLIMMSFIGGVFIGMGAYTATSASSIIMPYNNTATATTNSTQPIFAAGALRRVLFAATFPVGLVPIVLFGAELFTGNVMTMTIGMLSRTVPIHRGLMVLVLSFFANGAGCVCVAGIFTYFADTFDLDPQHTVLRDLVAYKTHLAWEAAFLRSVLCNIVVCLAVFGVAASEDIAGKLLVIYSLISSMVFMFAEHSIANMFLIPLGIMYHTPDTSFGRFLYQNLIPVTIGNTIGGVFLGAYAYFAYLHNEVIPLRDAPGPHPEGRKLPARNELASLYNWIRRRYFPSSTDSAGSPSVVPTRDNDHLDSDDEAIEDPVFHSAEHVV